MKGQKARAGRKIRPQARDVIKKIHKKRGYFFRSIQTKPQIVNLDDLEKKFGNEDKITTEGLFAAGLIKKRSGKMTKVKILGRGKLTKKLEFSKNLLMSESVKTAAARLKK